MKRKNNFLADIFEGISDIINGAEKSFIDLLSALVPYCVPIIPAYLTVYHTTEQMGFPLWVAYTAGFVTEVLGIASIATAIKFYHHNLKYKDVKNHAPFYLAVFTYVFYLVIILTVNVLLEVVSGVRSTSVIIAIALFSLLSLPSAVLISIRAQHAEVLDEVYQRREERRTAAQPIRAFAKNTEPLPVVDKGGKSAQDKTFR